MTPDEIKQLRQRLGWTQLQLAVEIGVDPMTVSRWERGKQPSKLALRALLQLQQRLARPRK